MLQYRKIFKNQLDEHMNEAFKSLSVLGMTVTGWAHVMAV